MLTVTVAVTVAASVCHSRVVMGRCIMQLGGRGWSEWASETTELEPRSWNSSKAALRYPGVSCHCARSNPGHPGLGV